MKKLLIAASIGLVGISGIAQTQPERPMQRQVVSAGTLCTNAIEQAINDKSELCVAGQWRIPPKLASWAEGLSIYDPSNGCIYQVNKGDDGMLRTALVGDSQKCAPGAKQRTAVVQQPRR